MRTALILMLGMSLTACGDKGTPEDQNPADAGDFTPVTRSCDDFPFDLANVTSPDAEILLCFSGCEVTTGTECDRNRQVMVFAENRESTVRSVRAGPFTTILSSSEGIAGGAVISNLPVNTRTFIDFRFNNEDFRITFSYFDSFWTFERLVELNTDE